MKKITVRKIAAMAGVSPATVSRALNNSPLVEVQTRNTILEIARETGFSLPHDLKNPTIAVIGDFFPGDIIGYYSSFFSLIYTEIARRGGHVELVSVQDLNLLNDRIIQGAINYSTSQFDISTRWYNTFSIPLVNINQAVNSNKEVGFVIIDTQAATREAIDCLWRRGHRRIAFLSSETRQAESIKGSRRMFHYKSAMHSHGIKELDELMFFGSDDTLEKNLLCILARNITAVLVPNEMSSIRLEILLHKHHVRVPETLSIVSWECPIVSEALHPPRSTISHGYQEAAREAVSLLYEMMHRKLPARTIFIPSKFIDRKSIFDISASEKASVTTPGKTMIQKKILSALSERPMSRRELATHLGVAPENGNFRKCLGILVKKHLVTLENSAAIHSRKQRYLLEDGTICENGCVEEK
ncbi:substrate-binding domain-containing protein [Victivallis vadensis]|uniref:Substrate-binding domain-containing protein n=1 Tax=Victivallis vadensis TaxID=172901 RepID=A0A848AZX0_9BACT|nr:substrate-binding domain-containing protein [Victivallis vadensis]NMD89184.1 substrate-binding domain-containing protein [Victivallis vadensis]